MKRSGFKKKTLDEVIAQQAKKKRTTVNFKRSNGSKKPKKTPIKTLKNKLWELCKQLVRKRDGNVCIICGKTGLEGSSWHTGHFLPSSTCGAFLRYDLRNLHSSCYNCNINLGGNGAMFYKKLVYIYGQDFVDKLFEDKNVITKADEYFYKSKTEEYTKIQDWDDTKLFDYTKIYTGKNS